MTNKEVLQELIDKIKEIKRIPQGKISILAGYETENYLSEVKSTGEVSENVIKAVRNLYERAKINPDILSEEGEETIFAKDAVGMTLENQVESVATGRVILSILAEIQAPQMRDKTLPTQLLNIYRKMVKDEAKQVRDELRQKS